MLSMCQNCVRDLTGGSLLLLLLILLLLFLLLPSPLQPCTMQGVCRRFGCTVDGMWACRGYQHDVTLRVAATNTMSPWWSRTAINFCHQLMPSTRAAAAINFCHTQVLFIFGYNIAIKLCHQLAPSSCAIKTRSLFYKSAIKLCHQLVPHDGGTNVANSDINRRPCGMRFKHRTAMALRSP